jgi:hypothetical protein
MDNPYQGPRGNAESAIPSKTLYNVDQLNSSRRPENRRYRRGEPPAEIDKTDRAREADDEQDDIEATGGQAPVDGRGPSIFLLKSELNQDACWCNRPAPSRDWPWGPS